MVHREKDIANPPSELMNPKWEKLKKLLLVEKHNHKPNVECYRNSTIKFLSVLYSDKCAMCERKRGTELQVDHFRPQKERLNKTNVKYNQSGYYWLAYEWGNLIPLCSKCNQNKSNKFPLESWNENNRISNHKNINSIIGFSPYSTSWLNHFEKPLLINPEIEIFPEKHFLFCQNGKIIGRTKNGIETINICDLNRKDLIVERKKIINDFVNEIKETFDSFIQNENTDEFKCAFLVTFRRIKNCTSKDMPHSLLHTFIYRYFEYFISSKLPISIREKSNLYFNQFKSTL